MERLGDVAAGVRVTMRIISYLSRRLKARSDKEHEMSFNRLIIATAFIMIMLWQRHPEMQTALLVMTLYVAVSTALLAHILVFPGASPVRRFVALCVDTICMSWQSYLGGESVAAFFPVYLWIIFGNGFRFGISALLNAVILTTLGFGVVIVTTQYWREQSNIAFGLWISLLVLPAYAGTLIQRLSKARQQAEEANEAKTMFLANVSHELRTPLTAIIGMGQLLQDTSQTAEQQDMLTTVQTAARSLLWLIDDLLKLARLDVGRLTIDRVKFDLPQLLNAVRRLLLVQANAKGLSISIHITPDVPLELVGGERQLREVLVNLVDNAIKFTDAGGVLVAVQLTERPEGGSWLLYEVVDTGVGIATGAKTHIFDTFTQADSTISARFGGTGLGLAISRRLASLLGGQLDVESSLGCGSSFRLVVPYESPSETEPFDLSNLAVCLLVAEGDGRRHLSAQFAELGVTVIDIDPRTALSQITATMDRWSAGKRTDSAPVLVIGAEGLGWAGDEMQAMLTDCAAIGLHAVFVRNHTSATQPDIRWLCTSTIYVNAPTKHLAAALRAASVRGGPSRQEPLANIGRQLQILVAEDNGVNQKVLMKLLEKAGHNAVLVRDGDAAVETLVMHPGRFDAVLMDVNMPRLDGLEATKLYRCTAMGLPHLPIIGLTADATEEMASRCQKAGMDTCLTKPFDAVHLLATLQRLVTTNNAPQQQVSPSQDLLDKSRSHQTGSKVLDEILLQSLVELGGEAFVSELIVDFQQEASDLIALLDAALQHDEFGQSYAHAHALQSMSSNMGACALVNLCEYWQRLTDVQMAAQADELARRADLELARVQEAFRVWQIERRRKSGLGIDAQPWAE